MQSWGNFSLAPRPRSLATPIAAQRHEKVRLNDLVCGDGYLIPLMFRLNVSALGQRMASPLSGWDLDMSTLPDWHRV